MTLPEALEDIRIAFLQVEFAIKLLDFCESGKLEPSEFDTDLQVQGKRLNLELPQGHFSDRRSIVNAASVMVLSTLGSSSIVLDKAWEVARICPKPKSQNEKDMLRTVVYMVRCAFAHGPADPKWKVKGEYCRVFRLTLPSGTLELDLRELDGEQFDFSQLGDHRIWFDIRDLTLKVLQNGNQVS